MFCLFDDALSFMMFSSFTAAQSNAIIYAILNEETWNELDTCWPRDKIQDLHDLFSSRSFHICAKKPQDK